jgi:hypothetical protein
MGRTACTEPQCLYKGDLYLYFYYIETNNQIPLGGNEVKLMSGNNATRSEGTAQGERGGFGNNITE